MPQRLTKSSIYSRSFISWICSLCFFCESFNQVCLSCEGILQQIPAFYFICASLEAISAIEMLWEWRGIANLAFIQLGWVSRVDEMILARVSSGFAGEEVWEDIQVVPGFWGGKDGFLGSRQLWSPQVV
ncbi:hypothetical protein Tco_1240051 [Tanacetum coccineum]